MTVKEHLHALVDSLTDEQARLAERALELVAGQTTAPLPDRASPFVGKFSSGHTDTSHRVDEILARGFGR